MKQLCFYASMIWSTFSMLRPSLTKNRDIKQLKTFLHFNLRALSFIIVLTFTAMFPLHYFYIITYIIHVLLDNLIYIYNISMSCFV